MNSAICRRSMPDMTHAPAKRRPQIARRLAAPIGLALLVGLSPPAMAKPGGDLRFAATRQGKIAYAVYGERGPTLVFISGLGDGLDAARDVAQRLGRHYRVLVYDRPGYGDSSAPVGDKTPQSNLDDLDALLDHAQVKTPVFLIGHSLGGQIAEHYAATHPDRVAGLVLDDARPGDFTARCLALLPRAKCVPPPLLVALFPPGMARDYAVSMRFEADFKALPPYAGPVLVLSRKPGKAALDRAWAEAQLTLAQRFGAAQASAPQGGHYVHKDAADWFDDQVRGFIAGVAQSRPLPAR